MKEVRIVIRKECVDPVVHALLQAEVPRLHVSHVHALGAGVDPADAHLSLEEGASFTEKARIDALCRPEDVERVIEAVREHAATGRKGDGTVTVAAVERVVSVRTGEEGLLAVV